MKKSILLLLCSLPVLPGMAQQDCRAYGECVRKADSLYMAGQYKDASDMFGKAFRHEGCIQGQHLYNAACTASLAGDPELALDRLFQRAGMEPDWYNDRMATDKDLAALHASPRWKVLADTLAARKERIECRYDQPLRRELADIGRSDQEVRWAYLNALREQPQDTLRLRSLVKAMQATDSVNQQRVYRILDERGWVGRALVGDANQAIWLVVQHSDLAHIQRYLPLFRQAAAQGELSREAVAMMEDRCLVWSGKPQKYGTQLVKGGDGRLHPSPLQDESRVDEWRKEAGMPPLDDYVRQMNATH